MENELRLSAPAPVWQRLVPPRRARPPLMALLAVGLVALLGFLYIKSQGVDYRRQGEILGYLRELREIDGRWDFEVLRARTEGHSGKAKVADDRGVRAPEILKRLQQAAAESPSQALARELPALLQAFNQKAELLQRYRAAQLTVTQALGHLVEFDTEIAGLVRGAWAGFPQRDRLVAVESTSALLFAHLMRYAADPTDAQRKTVETSPPICASRPRDCRRPCATVSHAWTPRCSRSSAPSRWKTGCS